MTSCDGRLVKHHFRMWWTFIEKNCFQTFKVHTKTLQSPHLDTTKYTKHWSFFSGYKLAKTKKINSIWCPITTCLCVQIWKTSTLGLSDHAVGYNMFYSWKTIFRLNSLWCLGRINMSKYLRNQNDGQQGSFKGQPKLIGEIKTFGKLEKKKSATSARTRRSQPQSILNA